MDKRDYAKEEAENCGDIGTSSRSREEMIEDLTRANTVLKANISTLFRTAQVEIDRLQSEIDELLKKSDKSSHPSSQQGGKE